MQFTLTDDGSALFTLYPVQPYDLSPFQNQVEDPTRGFIMSGVAQEVNVETGDVVWTWSSLEHIDPSQCYSTPADTGGSADKPWDYFHINSIEKDSKGNYLTSSRHCSAIYYVSGIDGSIIWQIGGQNSTFEMGPNTTFSYQHDARWHDGETTISLFDNAATGWDTRAEYARGMLLSLDMVAKKVDLVTEMVAFNRTPSPSQGSCERQRSGNWLLGWGQIPYISEYSAQGELLWSFQFGVGDVQSYRVHRANWTGKPLTRPALALINGNGTSDLKLYMSWNGATDVKTWEILAASSVTAQPESLWNVTRDGFESEFSFPSPGFEMFFVRARDSNAAVLGESHYVSKNGTDVGPGFYRPALPSEPSGTRADSTPIGTTSTAPIAAVSSVEAQVSESNSHTSTLSVPAGVILAGLSLAAFV